MPILDVKKPFGASVRSWRGRLGISQQELAGRSGLHRTYICDVERGARNVSLESIEKLARALEVTTAALFSYESAPGQASASGARWSEERLVDILYVEDNPHDAEIALRALEGITNSVQVAGDGQAALDYLFCEGQFAARQPSHRPQLILLDLRLPKMDGLEVLRRIKSDARTATIPVVVLTGSAQDRDVQTSERLGAAAYIVKPVDVVNLTHVAPALRFQWALLKLAEAPVN
ncbi:MAG TPA: response regulator [Verrucomicrobiae bacterium]|jgi:CheY-like chemotaxis protein